MNQNRDVFTSVFSSEIIRFLDYRVQSGFNERSFYYPLKRFDQFCVNRKFTECRFTKEDAEKWILRRPNEATTTHYSRVNSVKHFLIYLSREGFDVYIPRDIRFRPTDFQPHIYTEDEIQRYFYAVDHYESEANRKNPIQLPVLFRTLYCCGCRINETLGIQKRDVDLQNGIIRLDETKNGNERYIVMGSELCGLYRRFADKCFYLLADNDYIFTTSNGQRLQGKSIYEIHRKILSKAGIPYVGKNSGPRVHDWRHTFAVRSFKQLVDSGYDMYVALPVLSAYLGHKTIYATERYVRLTCELYPYIGHKYNEQLDLIYREVKQDEND